MGYGFGPRAVLGVLGMAWLGTPRGRRFWGERGAHGGRLMAETNCCKAWDETSAQSLPRTLDSWAHSYREFSFVPSLSQTRCCWSLWFRPCGAPGCFCCCLSPEVHRAVPASAQHLGVLSGVQGGSAGCCWLWFCWLSCH